MINDIAYIISTISELYLDKEEEVSLYLFAVYYRARSHIYENILLEDIMSFMNVFFEPNFILFIEFSSSEFNLIYTHTYTYISILYFKKK